MKRLILSLFLLLSTALCSTALAGVELQYADWGRIATHKRMAVELSLDSLKYRKTHPFNEFLYKEKRAKDWKAQSLAYFITNFNERVAVFGMEVYDAESGEKSEYVLRLIPTNVTSGGKLDGNAVIVDTATGNPMLAMYFKTSDGDDDDEITFRDPMRELGEAMGKAVAKGLKKL